MYRYHYAIAESLYYCRLTSRVALPYADSHGVGPKHTKPGPATPNKVKARHRVN